MQSSKRQLKVRQVSLVLAVAASMFMTGCATRAYVRQVVDEKLVPIDKKVTDLSASVKDNAERIDAVDRRATQGINAAATAQTAAGTAQTAATQANTAAGTAQTAATGAQRTADTANQGVQASNVRITTVENRLNNLSDRYTAGPIQTVTFKVGSSKLSDDAKKTLDAVAGPIASLTSGYQVEIQGFASAEGNESRNIALSQDRALAVQRYLVSKNIALIRISIIGNGPIGDMKDKEAARSSNRKVDVRVFRAN